MRGFGQTVIWDLATPLLWRVQQHLESAKWVAVRESDCIHSRLLGFCVHELIHAMCGDPEAPNGGSPVGLRYGVPESLPPEAGRNDLCLCAVLVRLDANMAAVLWRGGGGVSASRRPTRPHI